MVSRVVLLGVLWTVLSASVRPAGGAEGAPARLVWTDFDGDGLEDVYVVRPEGADSLFRNAGDGSFEDVTSHALPCVECASSEVAWRDVDLDLRPDLLRVTVAGEVELLRNRGDGVFEDVTLAAGLERVAGATTARWLDFDADGRADLELTTESAPLLYHNLGDFQFEALSFEGMRRTAAAEGTSSVRAIPAALEEDRASHAPAAGAAVDARPTERSRLTPADALVAEIHTDASAVGADGDAHEPSSGVELQIPPFGIRCSLSVKDTSTGDCVLVSSIPTLGKLYPISANLFVATSGDVGIGTTSPAAKLHVAGTARMTDTLTLAPGGDQALDVSTGSIYEGGVLFLHTKGGADNTGLGREALASTTSGSRNTANGFRALRSNTTGSQNTASGSRSLYSNTTGQSNTAMGYGALRSNTVGLGNSAIGIFALEDNTSGFGNSASGTQSLNRNTTGSYNTASGHAALPNNTTGTDNTACGTRALFLNTNGSRNIAVGRHAGYLSAGNDNIAIGNLGKALESSTIRLGAPATHTRTFIAGIRGVTTFNADAIPVVVDSVGQLGTVSSSRRFKKDIADMGDATARLLELRPVVFRYEQEQTVPVGDVPLEYGLIAEEVAEIFPELVVYDEDGLPFTVKYHLLSAMLLNELKELRRVHGRELEELRSRVFAIESHRDPAELPAAVAQGNP